MEMIPSYIEYPRIANYMNFIKPLLDCFRLVLPHCLSPLRSKQESRSISQSRMFQIKDHATMTNAYPVSESGMINMPFIGQVRAAGLRNEELQRPFRPIQERGNLYESDDPGDRQRRGCEGE